MGVADQAVLSGIFSLIIGEYSPSPLDRTGLCPSPSMIRSALHPFAADADEVVALPVAVGFQRLAIRRREHHSSWR